MKKTDYVALHMRILENRRIVGSTKKLGKKSSAQLGKSE